MTYYVALDTDGWVTGTPATSIFKRYYPQIYLFGYLGHIND